MIDRQFIRGVTEKVVANAVWAIILLLLSGLGTIGAASTGRVALGAFCIGAFLCLCLLLVPAYVSVVRERKRQETITCQLGWRVPLDNPADPRPDYRRWVHASFMVTRRDGVELTKARAYLEIQGTLNPDRARAYIGAADKYGHEIKVRSGEQYQIPAFLVLEEDCHLWIDTQAGIFFNNPVALAHITNQGSYLTNELFFTNLNLRQPLAVGSYQIQLVLRLEGHNDEFKTGFRTFRVE